ADHLIAWRGFRLGEFCRTEFEKVLGFPRRHDAIHLGVPGHRRQAKPATHREPLQPGAGSSTLIHEMSGGSFGRARRSRLFNTKSLSGLSIWQTNGLAAFLTKPGPGMQSNSPQQIAAVARSARLLLEVFLSGFC